MADASETQLSSAQSADKYVKRINLDKEVLKMKEGIHPEYKDSVIKCACG
ncbi:MAG: 50S ribosomal protein L31, partial [Flexistipes sinusarabici]